MIKNLNWKKSIVLLLLALPILIIFLLSGKSLAAAGNQFTLGPLPTPRAEVPLVSTSTVTDGATFVTAYTSGTVDHIVMTADITLTPAQGTTVSGYSLNRSLQIEGNGHKLSFTGNSIIGIFNISTTSTADHTLHLKNIQIEKTANDTANVLLNGGNSHWEYIYDDLTINTGVRFAWIMVNGSNINMFFRNTVNINKSNDDFAEGMKSVTFEANSHVTLGKVADGATNFFDDSTPYDNTAYFGPNCVVDIEGGNGYPIFYPWKQLDFYSGADVTLHKVADAEGVMDSYGVNQVYRIDSGASLKMVNGSGPAFYDWGNESHMLSNPGARIELIGNHTGGVLYFSSAASQAIFNSPSYYNIKNNNNGVQAFTSAATTAPALQLVDTNIGAWAKGSNLSGIATSPSPFVNASLFTGNTTALAGSSPALSGMPGGWSTDKYARIAFATPMSITANDQTLGINRTANINAVIEPSNAAVTYVSNNTGIATVDSNGVITGHTAGNTTLLITITFDGVSINKTINVTVTNSTPVLTVPQFTEISTGGTFNSLTGVSATDVEDGNLTGSISVTGTYDVNVAGVYPISYSVTDSDGNTATATQVLLVNDGSFDAGTNFILKASNFTKRVSQVDTTDAAIKTAAGVAVYSKTTGVATPGEAVTITNKGGYTNVPGNYTISFQVTSDSAAARSITGTVSAGNPPTLTVPQFTEISTGGTFNTLTGVSANDTEDGNITGNINVTGSYDVNVAGVYPITYTVTDSDGNTATATQVLLVNDGSFSVGANFLLKANDFTKRVGQVDTSDAAVKLAAGVAVYNKLTGVATPSEPVTIGSKGGYGPTVGNYTIDFHVTSDAAAARSVTGTVSAGNSPTLTVPQFTEINTGGTFNTLTGVSANDSEDGNITGSISVTGTYDVNVAGVYPISYSVTDSDGNTATATQVLLVNDGSFDSGTNFILKASDFSKLISQVDTTDAAIKTAAGVTVYNKLTGVAAPGEGVTITNNGGYTNVVGNYTISFQITSDTAATRSITATVSAGNLPTLTVPQFTEISTGGTFNTLTGVSATDVEDGNLTGSISVTGTYDVNVAGVYPISYSVTDSDGNTATATQVLLVNDGSFDAGTNFILKASNFTKRVSQVDTTDAAIKTAAGVAVYSKTTGVATPGEAVTITNKGGYTNVPGNYTISFQVTSDSAAARSITGTVSAGNPPTLTVPQFTEISTGGTFNTLTGVSANDTEDGNITGNINVTGSYDVNVAGVYPITYTVTDSDGNTATATQVLLVNDGSFSVGANFLLKANDFTKRVGQVDTSDVAVKLASGVTVYNKLTGVATVEPVTIVTKGGYTNVVGSYTIEFAVTADTLATRSITATVNAGNPPVLTVPAFTEISVGGTFNPLTGVSATDTEDGNLTSSITVTGSYNVNAAGVYPITYTVTDSDGNSVSKIQTLLVNNGNFVAGNQFIITAQDFTKLISEVDTSDNAVIAAAHVKVFDKLTGITVAEPVSIVNLGGYGPTSGIYTIQFEVTSDPLATIDIKGTVEGGNPPVITAPPFTQISVGGTFNPLAGVSAMDIEDGNLTSSITVSGSYDVNVEGIYSIDYSVTDSDGNTATARQVLLVNDGKFSVGDKFILEADSFTKTIGKVDTDSLAVRIAANVRVYDKETGYQTGEPVTITSLGGYGPAVGSYTIGFEVTSDPTTNRNVVATVITGSSPTLTVPSFAEVSLNGSFDPMTGVTANDAEDGSLTSSVVFIGGVDTTIPGMYELVYSVIDSDNNEATGRQIVLVNDGNFVVGNTFILKASDFTKYVGEVDTSNAGIKDSAGIEVYDKSTGALTSEAVTITGTGGYTATPGTYTIGFEVANDTSATSSITATVIAGELPILVVPNFTEVSVGGTFNPLAGVTATDPETGDITGSVEILNSIDVNTPGVYELRYRVVDVDNNEVLGSQIVVVNDGSFAVGNNFIMRAQDFSVRVSEVNTTDIGVQAAAGVEVYDRNTGMITAEPVTVNIGSYGPIVNTYPITFTVASETAVTQSITASVITGDTPVINGATFAEIPLGGFFNPLDGVTATDTEDGDLTTQILLDGSVNRHVPGVYTVNYQVFDADGNEGTATRIVLVNDGSFAVGANYLLKAQDFTVSIANVNSTTAGIISSAGAEVYDKATGILTSQTINIDSTGGYTAAVGAYNISMSVAGDSLASRDIIGTVTLGEPPIINGPTFTELSLNEVFDPMAGITATDPEQGDLTASITVSGTVDTAISGVVTLVYTVEDEDGNSATLTRVVLVNDGSFTAGANYIIKASNFTTSVANANPSLAALMTAANVTVYDRVTGDLSSQPVEIVDLGGYGQNPGIFTVVLGVVGDSGARRSVEATVVSGNPPELTIPGFTEISLGGTFDPHTGIQAIDVEDGDITSNIQIDNPVNVNKAGIYKVVYSITDSDLNKVVKTRVVLVNDGSFVVDNGYAITGKDFTLRVSEVTTDSSVLVQKGQVVVYDLMTGNPINNPNIIVDATKLKKEVGNYKVSFTFNPTIELTVTVIADDGGNLSGLPVTGNGQWLIMGFILFVMGGSLIGLRIIKKRL